VGLELRQSWERGKRSSIIVVAESGQEGHVFQVAERIRELTGLEPRICVFGHIQRGGTPTARDRILASRLGTEAVDIALAGGGMMAGEAGGSVVRVPLGDTWGKKRAVRTDLLALVRDLV
jgi:6-phosphofructokinase 1